MGLNTIYYARLQFTLEVSGRVVTSCYSSEIIINNTNQGSYSVNLLEGEKIYIHEEEANKVYYIYRYTDGVNDSKIVDDTRIKAKKNIFSGKNTQEIKVAVNNIECSTFGIDAAIVVNGNVSVTVTY